MVLTRSQARSRQPLDLAASSGARPPRRVSSQTPGNPQQSFSEEGVIVGSVINTGTVGGRSATVAAGINRPRTIKKCRSDCLCCPVLVKSLNIRSFQTGRTYSAINLDLHDIHCKLQNYIYVIKCLSCHVQYVGESARPLNQRMNIHRKGKSGCEISIDHFSNVCPGAKFSVQILEKLPGNGYINGKFDKAMMRDRLMREDYWMKTLRTVYPYGLNERTKFMNKNKPVGQLFPSLPRYGSKFINQRSRSSNTCKISDLDSLIHSVYSYPLEDRANKVRVLLNRLKHSNLKKLAFEAKLALNSSEDHLKRWYELIIDTFFTKIFKEEEIKSKKSPKHILPIYFHNKGIEMVKLNKILRKPHITSKLPENLLTEDPPSIVYSLSPTIRNKLFNYKETVESIDITDSLTYGAGFSECDCQYSDFADPDHGHIITGDLRFIENQNLRKLISKGPNYREPVSINWKRCKDSINNGIEAYIDSLLEKVNINKEDIKNWKEAVLQEVEDRITFLKRKVRFQKVNPILKRAEVVDYLQNLHSKFVLVPIDKAANNVCIICKKFYIEVILKEIGILGPGNPTYHISDSSKDEIIQNNTNFTRKLKLNPTEKDYNLPCMYWIPKKHKTPTGKRFIIASKHCSTKQISSTVSLVFKKIYKQVENFHKNAKFLSNYNKFWVLQNCNPVLETLKHINKRKNAKSISTFDFSTLYTKIPHENLIKELSEIIDFVFDFGRNSVIAISKFSNVYWCEKKPKSLVSFSKNSLKTAVKYLIENCYFTVGNIVLRQAIGIPMGIDPAPFWANLFLYQYEQRFMTDLIDKDKVAARHFHSTKRFIDDLCALNDGGLFEKVYRNIYPDELELKKEHSGNHGTFLNLDITIRENRFVYKLYDKRDAFPFSIIRMPFKDSNIPQSIFYSALVGEFLRIARSTMLLEDFRTKASTLCQRMSVQGGTFKNIKVSLRKIISRHPNDFVQFNVSSQALLEMIL